jgi:hypothetical protein
MMGSRHFWKRDRQCNGKIGKLFLEKEIEGQPYKYSCKYLLEKVSWNMLEIRGHNT